MEEIQKELPVIARFEVRRMIGGRFASLVVVPPQVAIVGAGRAERRVVVNNDQQVIHRMLPLSLTFDHRAVTGGEAARFLAALKSSLENP